MVSSRNKHHLKILLKYDRCAWIVSFSVLTSSELLSNTGRKANRQDLFSSLIGSLLKKRKVNYVCKEQNN